MSVDLKTLDMLLNTCSSVQRRLTKRKVSHSLKREEMIGFIFLEMKKIGESEEKMDEILKAPFLESVLGVMKTMDELRMDAYRAKEKLRLHNERCESLSNPLLEAVRKLSLDFEQHKEETAKKFKWLERKEISNTIDDNQLKMMMVKVEKLEKENSELKDQATPNSFEKEHKNIAAHQQEIRESAAGLVNLNAKLQEQCQKISILQKDLWDSESSYRELLMTHERVVQDPKDQKEKDDEQIQELLKKQEGYTTRIAELIKKNKLIRRRATSRVQALKDTVARQDRQIAALEKLAYPWK